MAQILQSTDDPTLIGALEANFVEKMAAFGRGLQGAVLYEDDEITWFYTGQSMLNGVLRARFKREEQSYIAARIAELVDYFRLRHVACSWAVSSVSRPLHLGEILQSQGFILHGHTTGMAADIGLLPLEPPQIPGFSIIEITDSKTLQVILAIEQAAFGSSEAEARNYYDAYTAQGFGSVTGWHHYLGWVNGEPAAMVTLLLEAGVAGIYGVATLPAFRKRGIGRAMVLYALRAAKNEGYRVAVLSPTDMSIRIYRQIGFRECCTIQHYLKSPNLV